MIIVGSPCPLGRPARARPQVYALAGRMPERFRVLVLAAAFTGLRWGELIALRRYDVDLTHRVLHVRRRLAQLNRGAIQSGPPKSATGVRSVSLPVVLVEELRRHIDQFAGPGPEGLVFRARRARCSAVGTSAVARSGQRW
jgi:integrase